MANRNVIFVLAALLLVSSAIAASEGPFIVAHKKASLTRLKSGTERISVSIDVYNQGSATAYDVTVNDNSWPRAIFTRVTANTTVSWERLGAGAVLSHSFELETTTKIVYNSAPAIITFRVPTKSASQEAYSTPIMPLDILADKLPEKKLDWAKKLFAKYGSLVSVTSIVVLFVYLIATPKPGASKGGKKKR